MNCRTSWGTALAVASASMLVGCALDEVTPVPQCEGGASLVIVAQSVPNASFVPCIEDRGAGWRAVHVQIDEDGTQLKFSLGPDRRVSGSVSFTDVCAVASDRPRDIERDGIESGDVGVFGRWYRFGGGCVVVQIADGVGREAAAAFVDSVVLVDRAELAADIRREFVDEEL
jgi:hypothetical protein